MEEDGRDRSPDSLLLFLIRDVPAFHSGPGERGTHEGRHNQQKGCEGSAVVKQTYKVMETSQSTRNLNKPLLSSIPH